MAERFGNDALVLKVLSTDETSKHKNITRPIQGDMKKWRDIARIEVLPAIREQFLQNPELQQYLLAPVGGKILGEVTHDDFWGIEINLDNPQVLDTNQYKGNNALGEILMTVRAELRSVN